MLPILLELPLESVPGSDSSVRSVNLTIQKQLVVYLGLFLTAPLVLNHITNL